MEFTVDRGELLQGLADMQGVVERRNTLPILANVLIEVSGSGLSVAATDLEVHVKRRLAARDRRPGAATAGARKLYELVRELKPGDVTIRLLENHFVEIVSGRSRVKLVGLPASDFPAFPEREEKGAATLEVGCESLARKIDCTIFAVSTDETRPHLGGVLLSTHQGFLRLVGTDGHRLALIEEALPGEPVEVKPAILPRKGLAELRRLLEAAEGSARITVGASIVRIELKAVDLVIRLVDGEFPNYEQVIPKAAKHRILVDKGELLSALRRVSVVASDRARGVKLHATSGQLEVAASSPDFGEAREEIEVSYSGDELAVGFNSRYLTDVLAVLPEGERVEIGLIDDASPGVIRSEDDDTYRYIVMPMRL